MPAIPAQCLLLALNGHVGHSAECPVMAQSGHEFRIAKCQLMTHGHGLIGVLIAVTLMHFRLSLVSRPRGSCNFKLSRPVQVCVGCTRP
jgi:hypothetical protein